MLAAGLRGLISPRHVALAHPLCPPQRATWQRPSAARMSLPAPPQPRIVLGSASRTRREILTELGFEFEIKKAGIDESAIRRERAEDLVMALAEAKAEAIQAKYFSDDEKNSAADAETVLLITADQVVVHEGRILEKPRDEAEAREFISGYSRSPPGTVGAVLVTNLKTGFRKGGVDATQVYFRPFPNEVVDKLVQESNTYESAGGLMVEHPLVSPFVESMVGTLDSVMGLSKALTLSLIDEASRSQ